MICWGFFIVPFEVNQTHFCALIQKELTNSPLGAAAVKWFYKKSVKRCHELFLGHELPLLSTYDLKLPYILLSSLHKRSSLQVFKMPPYASSHLFLQTLVWPHLELFPFLHDSSQIWKFDLQRTMPQPCNKVGVSGITGGSGY